MILDPEAQTTRPARDIAAAPRAAVAAQASARPPAGLAAPAVMVAQAGAGVSIGARLAG